MKIHPKHIGFDIDGVVADTMEAFIRLAGENYGLQVAPEEITDFQVEDCLDIDPGIIEDIFSYLLEEPLAAGLQPMPYAVMVLKEFAGVAPLTFITARPQKEPIALWLENALGAEVFRKVRLVATGEHDAKVNHIKDMGLRYFVDDRAQTCLMLDRHGISPFVYRQPWNHGKHDLATVADWLSIRDLCFWQ